MTLRPSRQTIALATVLFAVGTIVPAHGALPILVAGMGKQLIKNMLIDGVKSQLIGSLGSMGCKGAALASVLSATTGGNLGLPGGLSALSGGMPALPAGMAAMPGGVPSGMASMLGMPGMPGAGAMAVAPGAMGAMASPQMMAMLQEQLGKSGAAMPTMSAEQLAQMNAGMAAMQQAMAQPLSRAETLAVFDELGELGVMTPAMQSEVRDCVMLAPPSASASLGMTGAMMKNMVVPQLRSAREQMANLQPEEREQLATEIAQAMKDLPPEDRKAFQEGFGAGFFPPDVVTAVKSKLR